MKTKLDWEKIWIKFQTWYDRIDKEDITPEWEEIQAKIKKLVEKELGND